MSGFTESALSRRLIELNSSQQSVQTLSLWLIHHRKHYSTIVKLWLAHLLKTKESIRLVNLMYLANDVIQNSRKKGPEYGKEFAQVLGKSFAHLGTVNLDEKSKYNVVHILNVWQQRNVYNQKHILKYKQLAGLVTTVEIKDKKRKSIDLDPKNGSAHKKYKNGIERKDKVELDLDISDFIETHGGLSPVITPDETPKPEEIIKALSELENSASSDAAVRERIASLPPEVAEISVLSKIESKEEAEKFSTIVNTAMELITSYNSRLSSELDKRKKVRESLKAFAIAQKELTARTELRLEDYVEKLEKLRSVHKDLKKHVENLPNVKQLPDIKSGLAPLPSIGDLFNRI